MPYNFDRADKLLFAESITFRYLSQRFTSGCEWVRKWQIPKLVGKRSKVTLTL